MLNIPANLNELRDFRLTTDVLNKSSESQKADMRYAIQTNLRFLCNCVLRPNNPRKFPNLKEAVHGKIIDAFPKCDPDKPLEDWSVVDEYIVLASRGMLKSTIGAAFLTQVILCSPDTRILIISGKIEKSQSILDSARKPFLTNQVIRELFPDWAITPEDVSAEEFTTPRRDPELTLRDATMTVASFDSVKAGWHGELILFDDATNEQNSNTQENCEKTHGSYDETDELIEPNALRLFLGTKWHDEDLPEYIRKKGEEELAASGIKTFNHFVLPAWTMRTDGTPQQVEARENREKIGALIEPVQDKNGQIIKQGDVILTWPEKLSARFLFKIYRKNRADFYKQYLLDASLEQQKSFSPEVIQNQFMSPIEMRQIPIHDRAVVIHWDFASVWSGRRKKSENDYSCGIVGVFQKSTGRLYVADAVLAHFLSGDDMTAAIVKLYMSAMSMGVIVGHSAEDAVGVRNIDSSLMRLAKEMKVPMQGLSYLLPAKGDNAKNSNIALLAGAMTGERDKTTKKLGLGRVFINSNIPHVDEVKVQFEKWTIDAKRRKDDAPDCIAQLWKYYKDMIHADSVKSLQPDGPQLSWEPAPPMTFQDSHADETADNDYLASDTAPHA
jgi:hypothetical protein